MVEIQLPLPDSLHDYILAQISGGRYQDANDYLRALVEADKQQQFFLDQVVAHPQLESRLHEGLDSGPGRHWTPAVLNELKQQIFDQAAENNE